MIAVAAPIAVAFPPRTTSSTIQTRSVAAGARSVFVNESTAPLPALRALPPLNPNQPNHSRPAPTSTYTLLCGSTACRP